MIGKSKKADMSMDYQIACAWWPDLTDIWTPIGWKDHLFGFNVLWNGTIIAEPCLNRRTKKWEGKGAQFTFRASFGDIGRPPVYMKHDDGMVHQANYYQRDVVLLRNADEKC